MGKCMRTILFSISMYFMSFTPLWISVIFIDAMSILQGERYCLTEYISIIGILIGAAISARLIYCEFTKCGSEDARWNQIKDVKEEKTLTSEFLLAYILPLFAFEFTLWHQVVLFLIFFLTFGYLSVRHNYYCVNIVLEIVGYRFYHCTLENKDKRSLNRLVISKQRLNEKKEDDIYIKALNNDYSIDVSNKCKKF